MPLSHLEKHAFLKVATYNIHKGVQGLGPARRLEIQNLGLAIELSSVHHVHVIVVHLGLIPASRVRQAKQLHHYIEREVPEGAPLLVAGDFNDWGARITNMMRAQDLNEWQTGKHATYPSRMPMVQLDHVYAKGLKPMGQMVPHGKIWQRMSDHLPLVALFDL